MQQTELVPKIHAIVYGDPYSGKSEFAVTWPKPILAFFFDPIGKDHPYLKAGDLVQDKVQDGSPLLNMTGCPMKRVWKGQELQVQVEYYHEGRWGAHPKLGLAPTPVAYENFTNRLVHLGDDMPYFNTLIVDSLTYLEMLIRMREQFKMNPLAKDPRQWYGGAKMALETLIMNRFSGLDMNVLIICHEKVTTDDDTGQVVRGVNAVGQLSQTLPVGFSELYRMRADFVNGRTVRYLQTQRDAQWNANSSFAPNPCEPTYQAILEGWRSGQAGR